MDKRPEALRLADAMTLAFPGNLGIDMAAAELRRLHTINGELLKALMGMLALDEENHQRYPGDEDVCQEVQAARAAIAKATGE